jgi:hypothetical protein
MNAFRNAFVTVRVHCNALPNASHTSLRLDGVGKVGEKRRDIEVVLMRDIHDDFVKVYANATTS